jgi:hypothetical protein
MVMLVQESIILKTTIRRKKIVSVTLATVEQTFVTFCGLVSVILPCRHLNLDKFIGKIIAPNRC